MHRVHSAAHQWIAAQHPPQCHRSAAQGPEPLHRFHCIFRTCRHIPTSGRHQRRNQPLVSAQHPEYQALHLDLAFTRGRRGVSLAATPLPCCTAANARSISASSLAVSTVLADFLGLITTSTSAVSGTKCRRIASRTRRLMRLRVTAAPSTFPTVNPTRGPPAFSRSRKKTVILCENC